MTFSRTMDQSPHSHSLQFKVVLFTESNSPFGEEFLRILKRNSQVDLLAVVTRKPGMFSPDYAPDAADVHRAAAMLDVPVLRPHLIEEIVPILRDLYAQYFVLANYQLHLPSTVHELPKQGFSINFHVGPLPRYAGLIPWHWMWQNREKYGGVAAIRVRELIDAGEIIDECPVEIAAEWDEEQIRLAHFNAAYMLLDRVLMKLPLNESDLHPQNLSLRTYYDRHGLVERRCGKSALALAAK